jgi:hypothetical protein
LAINKKSGGCDMTWVIAILLGLILVAMVSSNQAAAAGVWTFVRFVLWGIALLAGWGVLVGYSVWFYATYPPSGEWTQIIGVACIVIIPPILLWFSRKEIAGAYKKNKWSAVRYGALLIAYIFVLMLLGVAGREVQAAYEYGGWLMILVPLAFTGSVLLWRSFNGSKGWREVWLGPPDEPEPWVVVMKERDAFVVAEDAIWEKLEETWDELTQSQQDEFRAQRIARMTASDQRLSALSEKLEAEKAARAKEENLTVMGFFWLSLIFAAFGLIGIAWDIGFAYSMELKFVKGQAWLAGAVVVFAGMVIAGLFISLWESIADGKAKTT